MRPTAGGFTLVEMAVSTGILVIALGLAMGGLAYFLRATAESDVQNELDIDVQKAMERIKYDIRLSSLDKMFFYPSGAGPYTAIAFPMARDDDGDGVVDVGEDGKIIWDRTLIYHVWSGEPNQLRLTVFDPRDNTLTDAERQQQIDSVAFYGNASMTHNSANARTEVVFENLFDWSITPRGSTFDGYAAQVCRAIGAGMGSAVLSPGSHTFQFKVTGKNASSSGYKIGVDSLVISPCMGEREAEAQLPVTAQSGATAQARYMSGGSWSGNYDLYFPATAVGQYFSISAENDRWESTTFSDGGWFDGMKPVFDFSFTPYDFVLALKGYGYAWLAGTQTGDAAGVAPAIDRNGCALRILVRGENMLNGAAIQFDGGSVWVNFRAGSLTSQKLQIVRAYIAECANHETPSMDIAADTLTELVSTAGLVVDGDLPSGRWSGRTAFRIDEEKSYVISLLLHTSASAGYPWRWRDLNAPTMPNTYIIPSTSNPTVTDIQAATWSTRADVITTNCVLGVQYLYTTYPTNGVYESPVIDTQQSAPAYVAVNWTEYVPADTDLQVKIRSANSNDMSDAAAWSGIAAMTTPGSINPGNRRYVQYRVDMQPNPSGVSTPKLRDLTLRWTGVERFVDISGTFTKGPDYGVFELTVDGKKLTTGVNIDLEIYRDARGLRGNRQIRSALTAEVAPRNTGR